MKIVDLSHVMNVHTPGWVGYAGNKMYYAQNLQTQMIVAQRIETALHVGTHFDGAMHATDGRDGDMASLPLDYLLNRGVVVDLSKKVKDWSVITPEMIEGVGADIREGDILILHTGWHRHYEGQKQQDLVQALGISFTVSTLALAATLAQGGALSLSIAGASLLGLAAALVGMAIGQQVRSRVREETFRFCFFLGLLLLGGHLALRPLF